MGEGGGGHKKEYSLYAFINVDNCERPLRKADRSRRRINFVGALYAMTVCILILAIKQTNNGHQV